MMDGIKVFLDGVNLFFLLYLIGYSTFLFLAVVVGSTTLYTEEQKRRLKNIMDMEYYVPVSIIVPAYNEEVTVVSTVRSLLSLDYKIYEIIVVDDGSKDETAKRLIEAFHMKNIRMPIRRQVKCKKEKAVYVTMKEKVKIMLICKENGGKSDALNMGINVSGFPYFLCIDADSVLQFNSLKKIVQPVLEDERIIAVGGTVRAANDVEFENSRVKKYRMPRSILASMQVMEYDRSFLAARILFDKFNGSMIISGAFGLFRKDIVIAVGGYDTTSMGEDMELVVRLHEFCVSNRVPYRIRYVTDAICWTQVPETLRDLCKQRKRWHIGLFQSMWDHRRILGSTEYGALGMISYVYFLLYELLSPYIELFGLLMVLFAIYVDLINIPFMILFYIIYAIYGAVLSITAFFARIYTIDLTMSIRDLLKAVGLCIFEVTILRFILAFVRMKSLIGYKRKKQDWGRIERREIHIG